MHSLHLLRVDAETAEGAIHLCESALVGWGNENNWRCFGGAISKSGKVYVHDRGARWLPSESVDIQWLGKSFIPEPINRDKIHRLTKSIEPHEWNNLSRMCYEEGRRLLIPPDFDVWKDTLFEYEFETPGITDLGGGDRFETWIVFLDVHS